MPNLIKPVNSEPEPEPQPGPDASAQPSPAADHPDEIAPSGERTSAETVEPVPVPSRRGRMLVCAMLAVAGVAAMVTGGVTVGQTLTRKPTKAEIEAAAVREVGIRWRRLAASQVFPFEIAHSEEHTMALDGREPRRARRVGIAPAASCAGALDPAVGKRFVAHGCRTVLRATYVDDTGTRVLTVGLAVMPDVKAALAAQADVTDQSGDRADDDFGLRAVAFPGTLADGFQDSRRQVFMMEGSSGPYVFLVTAGWADDRPQIKRTERADDFEFAKKILYRVQSTFAKGGDPCGAGKVQC